MEETEPTTFDCNTPRQIRHHQLTWLGSRVRIWCLPRSLAGGPKSSTSKGENDDVDEIDEFDEEDVKPNDDIGDRQIDDCSSCSRRGIHGTGRFSWLIGGNTTLRSLHKSRITAIGSSSAFTVAIPFSFRSVESRKVPSSTICDLNQRLLPVGKTGTDDNQIAELRDA